MHLSQRPTAVIGGNRSPSVFPSVLCASCLRTLSFLSSRHISPTERSRRFELPCRGVYLLRRSLSDSVVSPGSSYLYPLELTSAPPSRVTANTAISIMSSAASASTIRSIIDAALADYTKLTGTDLSKTPFATALRQSNSPEAVLQLLHEREKAFKEYRENDRKLIKCLSPVVKVVQAFSDVIGEAVSQVKPHIPSGHSFLTVTLSDPLPASKRLFCWDRYSS